MRSAFEYVDYALLATVVVGIVFLRVRRRGGGSAPDASPAGAGAETSPAAAVASTTGAHAGTAGAGASAAGADASPADVG